MSIELSTPKELSLLIGTRARDRRLDRGWSQSELSARAGVALSTLKVFERTGQISLVRLVRVMTALGHVGDLEGLLTTTVPASLDDMGRPRRQRGRSA